MPAVSPITAPNLLIATDWQPLRLLTFYRVILAGLLTVLYFALQDSNPFNIQLPDMFRSTLLTYLGFSVAVGFSTRLHWPGHEFQAILQVLADIGAITLLMHASGGVNSSLGILLVVAVAVGALVMPGRFAYLIAAVAALAVLFESGLSSLDAQPGVGMLTRAGLMGAAFFVAAGLAHVLVLRARESAELAERRGIDLENMEQLNRHVIRQLQSGLLVIDAYGHIRLANDTAHAQLGFEDHSTALLAAIAPELNEQLQRWKTDPQWAPQPVSAATSGASLLPQFSALNTSEGKGALILLEDSAWLTQQTQQVKLASLGRLTASIAHEIRNPLGAISHAAQLLAESEQLNEGDKRLTEIINDHTRRVNTVIENVLQLSRRSVNQPQDLPLQDWLSDFKTEFIHMQQLQPKQLELVVTPPDLQLRTDPGQLHQILTNLCQNAARHAGNPARLLLRAQRDKYGSIQLDIVDNGNGIDAEMADRIFEPFYTTESSGTGLGLFIARELCETNQGQLSYQPEAGGGSCFRIHFGANQGSRTR